LDVNVLFNGKENLGNFDSKTNKAIFLGYSLTSKAYRVFNKRTLNVEEFMHVVFYEVVDLEEMKSILKRILMMKSILKRILMKCT